MSKLDDRLAERQRQATEAAQGATRPAAPAPADNGQPRTETPAESPTAEPGTERPARPARVRQRAEKPAEMSKALRNHWRTTLQNAARKLARDREQLDESEQAWADTVAEARALGIPANVLVAAAADADVELPE